MPFVKQKSCKQDKKPIIHVQCLPIRQNNSLMHKHGAYTTWTSNHKKWELEEDKKWRNGLVRKQFIYSMLIFTPSIYWSGLCVCVSMKISTRQFEIPITIIQMELLLLSLLDKVVIHWIRLVREIQQLHNGLKIDILNNSKNDSI